MALLGREGASPLRLAKESTRFNPARNERAERRGVRAPIVHVRRHDDGEPTALRFGREQGRNDAVLFRSRGFGRTAIAQASVRHRAPLVNFTLKCVFKRSSSKSDAWMRLSKP